MNIKIIRPSIVLFTMSLFIINCKFGQILLPITLTPTPTPSFTPTSTPTNTPSPTSTYTLTPLLLPSSNDLIGTRWLIIYNDSVVGHLEYYLIFHENGRLESTYTNDTTPNNDTWEMKGEQIILSINDGYAIYTGKFTDNDTIIGTAENIKGISWDWIAYRK
jgi:hypothetical protein